MKPVVGEEENKLRSFAFSPLLRVALSLLLLILLSRKFDLSRIVETLLSANKGLMGAALGLYLLGVVICSYRWQVLLDGHDVRVPLRALTALYFVGNFFNNILPGSITGDVVKMYQLSRYSDRSDVAVSTVLMDRITGFLVLFAIAAGAVPFAHELVPWQTSVLILIVAVGMWGAMWVFTRRSWWKGLRDRTGLLDRLARTEKVGKVCRSMRMYDRRVTARALGISLVFVASWIVARYLIALALGVHLSIWYFLLFIPIISLVTLVPISFSGLGVREGAYVYLFSQVGVEAPTAVSMSLAFYGLRLVGGVIGGVIYALGTRTYLGRKEE